MADPSPHRLPRSILPRRYDLVLEPDLEAGAFQGWVEVAVEVVEPTAEVVLNAIELDLEEAHVEAGGRRRRAEASLDEATERATLALAEPLPVGPALVSVRFRGTLNDKLRGFYRSRFTAADGAERVIATTQFEPTDARRAFPCWDEPDLKAVFGITLVVEDGLLAVSNAGVLSEEPAGCGRRRVRFRDTMVMSTYLVACVVGPLEATEPVVVDGTPVRVVCVPGKQRLAAFGLEVAEFCLRYFADYFDLPYPGDTLDLVAIPDFAFGAMENLGCVTFRETLLLIDPAQATQPELQGVVDAIAHELAHMWFGDLVTMRWWNGIWLNEAFATFMELKATDAFRPEWERWVGFGLARTSAFDTDALGATRPVEYPVISPADAEGMFDVLTYEKGAAVVRMLEQYLGEDRFRDGIRRYMSAHRYANTETTDLWDAIEAATGEPVRRISDSWIFQGGYPLVRIEAPPGGATLRVSQQRFRYLGPGAGAPPQRWAIPLMLRYGDATGEVLSLSARLESERLDVDLPAPAVWVVGNAEGNGFYRVRYAGGLRAELVARAQRQLSALERYSLVDDTWACVLAGAPAGEFLDLVDGFSAETDVTVWRRIVGALDQLHRVVLGGSAEAGFAARVRDTARPALDRLGWAPAAAEEEGDRDRELRGVLLGALASLGQDTSARATARAAAERELAEPGSVEANVAAAAIRVFAAEAGAEELDRIIDAYRRAATPQHEQRSLYALAEVKDPTQFARVLDLAMSGEVRTQNAPFLIGGCIANRWRAAAAWELVEDRWEEMAARFPSNSTVRMLSGIRSITESDLADRVQAFLATHPVPQGRQIVEQHLERMAVTVALRQREGAIAL